MQSKVAHAAERKAFGIALDRIIKSASSKDREKILNIWLIWPESL